MKRSAMFIAACLMCSYCRLAVGAGAGDGLPANPMASEDVHKILKWFTELPGREENRFVLGQDIWAYDMPNHPRGGSLDIGYKRFVESIHDKTGKWLPMIHVSYDDLGYGDTGFNGNPIWGEPGTLFGTDYTMSCSTLDYFPTLIDLLGYEMPDERPVDGISLLPLIDGTMTERPRPIPYRFLETEAAMFGAPTLALIDGPFKFLTNLSEDGFEDQLYDPNADIGETTDILTDHCERGRRMRAYLQDFIDSCRRSHHGADYPTAYTPIDAFQAVAGAWR